MALSMILATWKAETGWQLEPRGSRPRLWEAQRLVKKRRKKSKNQMEQ